MTNNPANLILTQYWRWWVHDNTRWEDLARISTSMRPPSNASSPSQHENLQEKNVYRYMHVSTKQGLDPEFDGCTFPYSPDAKTQWYVQNYESSPWIKSVDMLTNMNIPLYTAQKMHIWAGLATASRFDINFEAKYQNSDPGLRTFHHWRNFLVLHMAYGHSFEQFSKLKMLYKNNIQYRQSGLFIQVVFNTESASTTYQGLNTGNQLLEPGSHFLMDGVKGKKPINGWSTN